MRAIKLSDLRSRGLALTAHEGVSVVHAVCRLMQDAAQRGRPISAPTLDELFVDETGSLLIEPAHPARSGSDSLARLLDDLLPADLDGVPPGPPGDAWCLAGDDSGARERAVLRALYIRVSSVFAPTRAVTPEALEALEDVPEPEASLWDESARWIAESADELPPPDPDVVDTDSFTPDSPATRAPARGGWERRAVLWGAALDLVLGAIIALKLGLIPTWSDLLDRATVLASAVGAAEPAQAPVPERRDDEHAVQQLPGASPVETPQLLEALEAPLGAEEAPTPAKKGVVESVAVPSVIPMESPVAGADHAAPSPDGRRVAFDLDRDGVRGVFIADRDGANVSLASGEGRAASPSWSPNGNRLAFVRAEPDRPTVWNLWMREMSTGVLTRLTNYPSGMVRGASWFPDGRRLCFAHQNTLVIQHVDSGRMQIFPSPMTSQLVRTPSVSPDGGRVAFEIEGSGIWMLEVGRRVMEQIIEDPTPSSLAWRPEAGGLTYYSVRAREWRTWRPAPTG